jgi:hypothetical protein
VGELVLLQDQVLDDASAAEVTSACLLLLGGGIQAVAAGRVVYKLG